MKKKYLILTYVACLLVLISLIVIKNYKYENNPVEVSDKPIERDEIINMVVESNMSRMTIEQKIAQMLILYDTHSEFDDSLKEMLTNNAPSGFIINKDNITTYEKTKKFVADLKDNSFIPLIISIDQEGGRVQRMKYLQDVQATSIPTMYSLGKTGDEKLAYDVGKVMAEELRTIGVNVVYAPVMDIYLNKDNKVIGDRSFGQTAQLVSKMSISLAKGLEDNGIIATYKHFPGHGDTATDSHYALPIITKSYEELKEVELKPFQDAIKNNAQLIMIGHIALPNIVGDDTPASLSSKLITDILKKDLGYNGLVITDALNMGALTKNYTEEQIYVKTIEAGTDLLLMPTNFDNAIKYIKENISEERIDESVKKIMTFKYKYLNNDNSLDVSYLGNDDHKKVIEKIG